VEVTGIYLHYRWLLSVVEVRKISRRQCAWCDKLLCECYLPHGQGIRWFRGAVSHP
jgi:hypothetical protein